MAKKSLIAYSSLTGNTEKVALQFKKVFEKKGWQCDMFKIDHRTNLRALPFKLQDYDFLCVGSPVIHKRPLEEIVTLLFGRPLVSNAGGKEAIENRSKPPAEFIQQLPKENPDRKIILGPDTKKGVIFMTYGGIHLGPKEVEPAIGLLALLMEHIPFECVGKFSCPGRFAGHVGWYKDLEQRPNERDLQKAEFFIEEVLEGLE
jgi:hypothetical protein